MSSAAPGVSPFLHPPAVIPPSSECPSIVHLRRDQLQAITVGHPEPDQVLGSRFGDFPHRSFVGKPFGSQIASSSAKPPKNRKRKRDPNEPVGAGDAGSGFVHILAPTAELWTNSLPHRTQVVYTPDSSYILQRLGVQPGSVVIEAGAGSGSFTHAAVRAVYRGYPDGRDGSTDVARRGKVWSYEFHEERAGKLKEEIRAHQLESLVEITHRDVCKDGFLIDGKGNGEEEDEKISPGATAIFLDLPAPWLALPHLSRRPRAPKPVPSGDVTPSAAALADPTANITVSMPLQSFLDPSSTSSPQISLQTESGEPLTTLPSTPSTSTSTPLSSPLSPTDTVRICCFSPCIEQVTRTTDVLRKLGWVDVDMVEIAHTRLEVRRQREKGYEEGAGPRTVAEALQRLKGVSDYREARKEEQIAVATGEREKKKTPHNHPPRENGKKKKGLADPDEGRLVIRREEEIKSHTSYLTFATLPREWTEEDEKAAEEMVALVSKGPTKPADEGDKKPWIKVDKPPSKRQLKKQAKLEKKAAEAAVDGKAEAGQKEDQTMPNAADTEGSGQGKTDGEGEPEAKAEPKDPMDVDL